MPITKVRNILYFEEFRPINMLRAIDKILKDFIANEQKGFRRGYNYESAIWKKSS